MKAYIGQNELWPCYGVVSQTYYDFVVDVPEETIRKWRKISALFHKTQGEIEQAIREYEHKMEVVKYLKSAFAKVNPSRRDKEYILVKFGWEQKDTSLWEKEGRQVRLHDAYNECKQAFEEHYE